QVADAKCRCAHHLALQRQAIFVAARHLQNGFDTGLLEQACTRKRAHVSACASAISHIHRIGEALECGRLAQEFLCIARDRRYQLPPPDESPPPHPLPPRARQGAFSPPPVPFLPLLRWLPPL